MTSPIQGVIQQDLAIHDCMVEIERELRQALRKFPPFHSAHEGFAIIDEEHDELWEEVRRKNDGSDDDRKLLMREEAIQVAAMAARFMMECT